MNIQEDIDEIGLAPAIVVEKELDSHNDIGTHDQLNQDKAPTIEKSAPGIDSLHPHRLDEQEISQTQDPLSKKLCPSDDKDQVKEINPEPQVRFRLNVLEKVQVNQTGIFVAVGAPAVSQLKLQSESPDSGLREPVFQLLKSLRMITC
ncbi:hypothetical protein HAX54_022754 [Datura stramonium]|uniref:Uncharacterized protein n=1 Tax=Datura stramonium TaxID=4076 RepID=A0ABS8S4X3_DATST|nr:hypothetical protein [Datura stramonium]